MFTSERSSQLIRAYLIAARMVLIISLWQAPIPCLHCHGTDVSKSVTHIAASKLTLHLLKRHPEFNENSEHDFGWHCHWVLPFWGHGLEEASDSELPFQGAFAFNSVTVSNEQLHSDQIPMSLGLGRFDEYQLIGRNVSSVLPSDQHSDWCSRRVLLHSVLRC